MMPALLILWAGFFTVLVVLLIYRSTLSMHEDDQLFLDDANIHLAKEQEELTVRMDRLKPWIRLSGAASALLIVVIAGMFVYARINQ
ncbi:MAG TPA: hypothetical protein VG759_12875 [Candidatus Angelobacter sp.]|jgi:hypothetical protein|nr:hypothetical protein [Candidatus Angelobacter sp.]